MPFTKWHNNRMLFHSEKGLTLYIKVQENQVVTSSTRSNCLFQHLCQMSPLPLGFGSPNRSGESASLHSLLHSLCASKSLILSHFTSCILIQRLVSLFPEQLITWQPTAYCGMAGQKQLKRTVTSSWKNIILCENCTQDRTSDLSPRHERFIFNYKSKLNARAPWGRFRSLLLLN